MWKSLALLCLLPLLLVGCNDEDCAECPDPAPQPTMANLWPHQDGAGWMYDLGYKLYEGPPPGRVAPPLPTMQDLHDALGAPVDADLREEDQALFRLRFDGVTTTESGVVAQNLTGTTYHADEPPSPPPGLSPDAERRLLGLIARARSDLRPRIRERLGAVDGGLKTVDGHDMYALGECAFSYEDDGYYAYGDLNSEHSWIFLQGDLTVGSGFSLQLVPELADDIWLYGRIWSIGDRTVGGEAWSNVLECMYVIDMGIQEATDEQGGLLGEYRSYMYYTVLFAPEYGPIMSTERQVLAPDPFLQEGGAVIREFRCDIVR